MSLEGRHILSCDVFDRDALARLFKLADVLRPVAYGRKTCHILAGAVMGSLFFEPSTRTRLSFDSAFMKLGGAVSSTIGMDATSIVKGESLADTSRVISGYYDVLVVRHPEERAVFDIAGATNIPTVNGGNGAGEHPTQALLDLYTLIREFSRLGKAIDGSRIVLAGDLRYGRTVHSLVRLLSLYDAIDFVCVSPAALPLPSDLIDLMANKGHRVRQTSDMADALERADAVYATRIQKERFDGSDEAIAYATESRIDSALVNRFCRPDVVIMHPLPRDSRQDANDLSTDLNQDSRLAIFRQTDAGIPTRMALFASILGVEDHISSSFKDAKWYRPAYIGPDDADFYATGEST